jgi:hypothetical protein
MGKVIIYVVGDAPDLSDHTHRKDDIHVKDLEELKKSLVKNRHDGPWQLVISMHGNVDLIATKGGNVKNPKAAGIYRADDIRKLFNQDKHFTDWRENYGPTRTFLNACQVEAPFESVIYDAFNKPGTSQRPQGLGKGCRPDTSVEVYFDRRGNPVTDRSQWGALSAEDKAKFKTSLSELNKTYGYFGQRVPDSEPSLFRYYFDIPPKGAWPKVTVSINKHPTDIVYLNRALNGRFIKECPDNFGPIGPPRIPQAPQALPLFLPLRW